MAYHHKSKGKLKDPLGSLMASVKTNCPLCKEPFKYRINLKKHIRQTHSLNDIEKFVRKKL